MKAIFKNSALLFTLSIFIALPNTAISEQPSDKMDVYSGHFSREGNYGSPAKTTNSNIFIKLFENQWIVMLYVPLSSSDPLDPAMITKALEDAKKQASSTSAYIRDTFGQLEEKAIATVEKFGFIADEIVFECNSLAPCTIKLKDNYLELVKPGIINEHIIKYNHVPAL